ncbi:MAG TPA: hypothetical protein VH020_08425 [Stellaceae bacterium]|jgi:hypothetical protein|nr:hypothetical protein [Stellaceae bacterium]
MGYSISGVASLAARNTGSALVNVLSPLPKNAVNYASNAMYRLADARAPLAPRQADHIADRIEGLERMTDMVRLRRRFFRLTTWSGTQ